MSPIALLVGSLLAQNPAECPFHAHGTVVVGDTDPVPSCLETVDGDLIVGTDEQTLDFSNLTDVTGRLELTLAGAGGARFPRLERVHGGVEVKLRGTGQLNFPRLTQIFGPLGLDLDARADTHGLTKLKRLHGGLWLFGGGNVRELLPNLEHISGTLFLQPDNHVVQLLPSLSSIGGHLVVSDKHSVGVDGLGKLEHVSGGVYIFGSKAIALPHLQTVEGTLALRKTKLTSLQGIGRKGTTVGGLALRDNPSLRQFPSHLNIPKGTVEVQGSPLLQR